MKRYPCSRQSFDEPRIFRRIIQSIAQTLYRGIQPVIEVHNRIGGPQFPTQSFARNDIACVFEKGD
jgi:hypothetical protein